MGSESVIENQYVVPQTVAAGELIACLSRGMSSEPDPSRSDRIRFHDTFDWRLHRAGSTLLREAGRYRLVDSGLGGNLAEAPTATGPWPRFAADFPAGGAMSEELGPLIKRRALIRLLTVGAVSSSWRIRDRGGRIVMDVELCELRTQKPAAGASLRLLRLRPSSDRAANAARVRRAKSALAALGVEPPARPPLDLILESAGLEPEAYSSKFSAELDPAASAIEAATLICRELLRTMRVNEPGLKADVDTDFLHDFRVSIRRTRSMLKHFRGIFAADPVAGFRGRLASVGRVTGPLRDLDVYLLDESRYRAMLPEELRPGLDGLFSRLAARRRSELSRVRRELGSQAYRSLVSGWDAFLAAPPPGPHARQPALDLVRLRLRNLHTRVLQQGRAVGAGSPDVQLHRLRIECKKLRYLLDCTASLFSIADASLMVFHLKGLQDNLGEFNDLSVQQRMLRCEAESLSGRSRARMLEAAALDRLISVLADRQSAVRNEFAVAFADFAGAAAAGLPDTSAGRDS